MMYSECKVNRKILICDARMYQLITLSKSASNAGDKRSRNLYQKLVQVVLYKKLARVSVNLVPVFWLVKFLACNIPGQKLSRHVTRTVQHDWPASCCCARNCDELVSNLSRKCFLHMVQLSWTCVAGLVLTLRCGLTHQIKNIFSERLNSPHDRLGYFIRIR